VRSRSVWNLNPTSLHCVCRDDSGSQTSSRSSVHLDPRTILRNLELSVSNYKDLASNRWRSKQQYLSVHRTQQLVCKQPRSELMSLKDSQIHNFGSAMYFVLALSNLGTSMSSLPDIWGEEDQRVGGCSTNQTWVVAARSTGDERLKSCSIFQTTALLVEECR